MTFELQTSTTRDDLRIITEAAPIAVEPSSQASAAKNVEIVALKWNAPAYNNNTAITNYLVQYSTDNGHTWNSACNTSASNLNAKIIGL